MSGASDDRHGPAEGSVTLRETASGPCPEKKIPVETASGPCPEKEALRETVVDPQRMEVFIEAMTPPGPASLRRLEEEAIRQGVPIIRPQTQNLLRFFCAMKRPARILEIGTGTGFSALFMQYYAPADCRILTIEKDPERARRARDHFREYGRAGAGRQGGDRISALVPGTDQDRAEQGRPEQGRPEQDRTEQDQAAPDPAVFPREEEPIRLLEGDAAQILSEIHEDASFDLIFMDAAKGQYIRFLPDALRLLCTGGILITDNILQEGEILSSRFAVTRRNRTIHSRMRAYLRALAEEPSLETLLVPTGDGAAVCLKR